MDLPVDLAHEFAAAFGCGPCLTLADAAPPRCGSPQDCDAATGSPPYHVEFLPGSSNAGDSTDPPRGRVTVTANLGRSAASRQAAAPLYFETAAPVGEAGACAELPSAQVSTDGRELVVSPDGDDASRGTPSRPWRTLRHAFDELRPGDTLLVHGGTYREEGLTFEARGEPEAPIVVMNVPGEKVVVDGSIPEFQTAGNDEWVLVAPELDLYRSRRTYDDATFHGKMEVDGELYALNVYEEFEAIASARTAYDESGRYYLGPGLHWRADDRHLYVRLQPPDPKAVHGRVFAVPEDPDPRRNRLHIGTTRTGLRFDGARDVVVKGLEIRSFLRTVEIREAERISLLDLTLVPGRTGILLRGGVRDVALRGFTFAGGFPAWVSWRDVKSKPRVAAWLKLSGAILNDDSQCVSITQSRFLDVFDGVTAAGAPRYLRVTNNAFDRVIDDALQLGTASAHVEFGYNLVFGAGPSHHGSGPSPAPGSKYIHHNVIDVRDEELYHRLGQGEPGWRFHLPLPSHTLKRAGPDPWKIYHNTILFSPNTNNYGAGQDRKGPRSGPPHEVYNNIFLQRSDWRAARDARVDDGAEIFDGNLYHRAVSDPQSELLALFEYGEERESFASLEDFRRSRFAEATQAYYAPGWERHGVEADTELRDPERCYYRPAPDSPAASGGLDLSATGWPGSDDGRYRGAVEPDAATGLGAVGLTSGTRCETGRLAAR